MKEFKLELKHKSYGIKNKKEAYYILDRLNKDDMEYAINKYIHAKGYKYIKNMYQLMFNYFNHNENDSIDYAGKCIICSQPTTFNLLTKKYARLDKDICKEKYVKEFKERMNKVYGRTSFVDDPDAQRYMLNNRKITQKYTIGKYNFNAVGNYEVDFLDFMFKILKCDPADIVECPFNIPYIDKNNIERTYIPDFYIPTLNLVIEIKSSKSAYANRDHDMEMRKKEAGINYMKNRNGYYFYLLDKNYSELLKFLSRIIGE